MARLFVAASSQSESTTTALLTVHPITLAAWVRLASTGTLRQVMGIYSGGTTNHRFTLQISSSNQVQALIATTASSTSTYTTTSLSAGVWYHVAAVFASITSRTAYFNGLAATAENTSRTPTAPTRTGIAIASGGTNFFDGDIAEAAIWSVALTDNELKALAKGILPNRVSPGSLTAYWPMYGNGATEQDFTSGRHGLTLNSSPTKSNHAPVMLSSYRRRSTAPLIGVPNTASKTRMLQFF